MHICLPKQRDRSLDRQARARPERMDILERLVHVVESMQRMPPARRAGSMKRLTQTLETPRFPSPQDESRPGLYGLRVKPDEASPLSWETRK